MKRRIRYRLLAERDLEDVAAWYEGERPGLGEEFVAAVHGLTRRLAENALQFPAVSGVVRRALLKRFPYAIFFIVENGVASILAVAHLHRAPDVLAHRVRTD